MKNESEENFKKEVSAILSRYLILLSSFFVFLVITILSYTAVKDSIGNSSAQKYDKAYFTNAVKSYGDRVVDDPERVANGIHVATGMVVGKGFHETRSACLGCHSSKLIIQNRATKAGWESIIDWMQATQALPSLGKNHDIIIEYLARNYAPEESGRRANLNIEDIEWYTLNLDQ